MPPTRAQIESYTVFRQSQIEDEIDNLQEEYDRLEEIGDSVLTIALPIDQGIEYQANAYCRELHIGPEGTHDLNWPT